MMVVGDDFAVRLEKAVERANAVRLIEHSGDVAP